MKIGFTGTRSGVTDGQKAAFGNWLYERCFYGPTPLKEFHHGCCVGADAFAVLVVNEESPFPQPKIVAHAANVDSSLIDGDAMGWSQVIHKPLPPLERNRNIVNAVDVMLACPAGMEEEQRSGTWATIRFARKQKKHLFIFWPDGTVTEENG